MRRVLAALALSAVLSADANAGEYPERWAFWHAHIETPAECAAFSNMVVQAAKDGCTAVCFGDGVDYYSTWGDRHRQTLAAALKHCRDNGLQVVACVWSLGYGAMLNYGYELMEGVPLDELSYIVGKDCRARFRPSQAGNLVPNGGFEKTGGNGVVSDWTFIDGLGGKAPWAVRDDQVKHGGEASLRFEVRPPNSPSPMQTRASHRILVKPGRRYRLGAWVKTENLKTGGANAVRLFVQRENCDGKNGMGEITLRRTGDTQDWTHLAFEFNSQDYTELRVWAGVWGGVSGRFWLDDVSVEEVAPKAVLHNYGSPVTVQRKSDGRLLTEGLHFAIDPPLSNRKWAPSAPPVEIAISAGAKWIREGDELLLSCCTPATSGSGNPDQVSICLSDPALYKVLARSAETVQRAVAPDQWLIGFDEARNGNTCRACRARGLSAARIMADSVSRQYEIIKKVNPDAKVWVWSDMFCPWENAHESYYSVRGSCVGGVEWLPKDLGIACWGAARHAAKSMAYFAAYGHRTLAAAFYDESAELKGTQLWLDAMNAVPRCAGVMYTTWRNDFSLMDPFWKMVKERSEPLPQSAPRVWRDRWIFEHTKFDSRAEAEGLAEYVRRAAKKGCNGFALIVGDDYMCRGNTFDARPSKSWAAGWEDCDQWDGEKWANWRIVKDACAESGIEVVPLVWSLGYASPTHADAGLVSVQQVTNAPYVARGGAIVFDPPAPLPLPPGAAAAGEQRQSFRLPVAPRTTYRFSFLVKTENLADAMESFRLSFSDADTGESRSWARPNWWGKPAKTEDWHRITYDVHSGDARLLSCFMGLRKGDVEAASRLWWKDFTVRAIGFQTPIVRVGAPFVVSDAETGRVYSPGRDYVQPKIPADLVFGGGEMKSFAIPKGSAIKEGRRLRISGYEPIAEWGKQFSTCLNHPRLRAYFNASAARVQKNFAPRKWFFSMDEFRCGCRCELCRRDGRTCGKQLSDTVRAMFDIVRRVSPEAEVYMWPDMFDPEINAHDRYYQLPSTADGSWRNLPREIVMANWGTRPRNSYKFFSQRGFRTQCATYYDEDVKFVGSRNMLNAAAETPNCLGWTYTPWGHSRKLLEKFVDLADATPPVVSPAPPQAAHR